MFYRDLIYYKNNSNRPAGARRCMGAIAGGTFGLVVGALVFSILGQAAWILLMALGGLIIGYNIGPKLISNK